jgi:hypothetical protein
VGLCLPLQDRRHLRQIWQELCEAAAADGATPQPVSMEEWAAAVGEGTEGLTRRLAEGDAAEQRLTAANRWAALLDLMDRHPDCIMRLARNPKPRLHHVPRRPCPGHRFQMRCHGRQVRRACCAAARSCFSCCAHRAPWSASRAVCACVVRLPESSVLRMVWRSLLLLATVFQHVCV